MPRKWTKEQRAAQSIKIKAVWARKKKAKQKAEPNYLGGQQHSAAYVAERKPVAQSWWQRVMQAVGFRHGT